MGIYRYDLYKSPNIGLFAKTNDHLLIVPFGVPHTKSTKLSEYLQVEQEVFGSIAGTRLIGAMTVMNNNGILVPATTLDEEIQMLKQVSGLNVERLKTKFTAIGNLISSNDNGALISPLFENEVLEQVQDVLGVPTNSITVAGYVQIGSAIVATNLGAAVHPKATDEEIENISDILKVPVEPVTVNGGIPFLSYGMLANSKSVVVGSPTSGPELVMIT
ncbi:MAG TPA: translation initiation factor IF-6, partial [Nitrososphaeraceae archaeon]|nr:translation initiation factor IF-6 [Nitrososphaeraceae archaeon]